MSEKTIDTVQAAAAVAAKAAANAVSSAAAYKAAKVVADALRMEADAAARAVKKFS